MFGFLFSKVFSLHLKLLCKVFEHKFQLFDEYNVLDWQKSTKFLQDASQWQIFLASFKALYMKKIWKWYSFIHCIIHCKNLRFAKIWFYVTILKRLKNYNFEAFKACIAFLYSLKHLYYHLEKVGLLQKLTHKPSGSKKIFLYFSILLNNVG